VRVYLSAGFVNSGCERSALYRLALPRLRAHCDSLSVSVSLIDLRQEVCLPTSSRMSSQLVVSILLLLAAV
jgi:hypothetical protein